MRLGLLALFCILLSSPLLFSEEGEEEGNDHIVLDGEGDYPFETEATTVCDACTQGPPPSGPFPSPPMGALFGPVAHASPLPGPTCITVKAAKTGYNSYKLIDPLIKHFPTNVSFFVYNGAPIDPTDALQLVCSLRIGKTKTEIYEGMPKAYGYEVLDDFKNFRKARHRVDARETKGCDGKSLFYASEVYPIAPKGSETLKAQGQIYYPQIDAELLDELTVSERNIANAKISAIKRHEIIHATIDGHNSKKALEKANAPPAPTGSYSSLSDLNKAARALYIEALNKIRQRIDVRNEEFHTKLKASNDYTYYKLTNRGTQYECEVANDSLLKLMEAEFNTGP